MPDLSLLWRKDRHIVPPGTLGVATSSYNFGKYGVKGTQATLWLRGLPSKISPQEIQHALGAELAKDTPAPWLLRWKRRFDQGMCTHKENSDSD